MSRKLASIQRIITIDPIENADKIEVATILGWKVVVGKGQFKVNDLVVYCEVDSLIPYTDWSSFLFKEKKDTFHLKTIRLRKQISQGLVVSTDILNSPIEEGRDVTEELGIIKYIEPIPAVLQGEAKRRFPSWLPKTDETRIQAYPKVLERHRGKKFYITEKCDGSSMTVYIDDNNEFGVCSRNLDLKENKTNTYWKVARELKLEEKLRSLGLNRVAIQGELIGRGIQKNIYRLENHEFKVFNVFFQYKYLDKKDFLTICEKLELKTVPILYDSIRLNHSIDDLIKIANEESRLYKGSMEGIVLRTIENEIDEDLGRLSFKVINPEYLIKND